VNGKPHPSLLKSPDQLSQSAETLRAWRRTLAFAIQRMSEPKDPKRPVRYLLPVGLIQARALLEAAADGAAVLDYVAERKRFRKEKER
jgi:hypothetical protein